ncbi:MAG: tetratricopeptide repeat protein, partial [Candidatus Omnitrophica bacterium]|nr:tetratricopeptide repeat protein [Candidatus Omnitrophota bacterium]
RIKKEKLKIILTTLIFLLYGTRTILRNYDWNDEIKFYKKSLKYFPDSKRIIHNYGVMLMMNGKYKEALSEFKKLEKVISNREELSKATIGIGKCYFMLGNYEESMKYYNKTIELDPLNFDALTSLALIYERRGDIEKSLNYLLKAYKINPYSSPTLYLIGKIYFDKKQYDIAERIFIKAIEIEPEEGIYWNKLGMIYYNKSEFDKSLYCFENAYKFNNKDLAIILNLARNYQKVGRHNHAIFYFNKAFQINPETKENIYILNDYAISLNEIGEKEKAIEILNKILKTDPDFQPAKINLKIITSK